MGTTNAGGSTGSGEMSPVSVPMTVRSFFYGLSKLTLGMAWMLSMANLTIKILSLENAQGYEGLMVAVILFLLSASSVISRLWFMNPNYREE